MNTSVRWHGLFLSLLLLSGCASLGAKPSLRDLPPECISGSGRSDGPAPPVLKGVSPGHGSTLGGERLTLIGDGFGRGTVVFVGGALCSESQVLSGQRLMCRAPERAPGIVDVVVMSAEKLCARAASSYNYVAAMEIRPKTLTLAVGNRASFDALGGKPPYRFSVPVGKSTVDAENGYFSAGGEPGAAVVRVMDSVGSRAEALVTVNPPLRVVQAEGKRADEYGFSIEGGVPPFKYETVEEPTSLAERSGTATVLRVRDAMGNTARFTLSFRRKIGPLLVFPAKAKLQAGERIRFTVSGGKPPYRFELHGRGRLNPKNGVYLAPDEAGIETVTVTDAAGVSLEAQVSILPKPPRETSLALGALHTCALREGRVSCWGDNSFGALGNGTLVSSSEASPVVGLEREVIGLVAGQNHSCALLDGGAVKCWGDNRYGQLGDGSGNNSPTPTDVMGLSSEVQAIAAGQFHTCALTKGRVFCWGSNAKGQLGDGTLKSSGTPKAVANIVGGVTSITAGAAHTCALAAGGVLCWGANSAGQLGDGTTRNRQSPVAVSGLTTGVKALSAGGYHTCAVLAGRLKCWGHNGLGQLGTGTGNNETGPVDVTMVKGKVVSFSAGFFHNCAVLDPGSEARCWGFNQQGQLGNGSPQDRFGAPVAVRGLGPRVSAVAAGVDHSCAVSGSGIQCWGRNSAGQIGIFSKRESRTPASPVSLE